MIGYGIKMAQNQLNIIYHAEPIEKTLHDESISDSLKAKIRLVQEIRQFAFDSIGLKYSKNYSTFYLQPSKKPLLWTISACPEFSLEPYEWGFPLIGKFPYKGYFNLKDAENEAEKFEKNGFDVEISPVGGWSTLGWFTDPILSGMLRRNEAQLADLIIHELSHSTFFVKNDATLNENIANFIGKKGAIWYMESKYGKNNQEVDKLIHYYQDDSLFNKYMLEAAMDINQMYDSNYFKEKNDATKRVLKANKITHIIAGLDSVPFYYKTDYTNYFAKDELNNAYLTIFSTYEEKQAGFDTELALKHQNDLRLFVKAKSKEFPL